MPEHNLEPPRFSRRALERILADWTAVRAMLMTGCREHKASRYVDVLWIHLVSHFVTPLFVDCQLF